MHANFIYAFKLDNLNLAQEILKNSKYEYITKVSDSLFDKYLLNSDSNFQKPLLDDKRAEYINTKLFCKENYLFISVCYSIDEVKSTDFSKIIFKGCHSIKQKHNEHLLQIVKSLLIKSQVNTCKIYSYIPQGKDIAINGYKCYKDLEIKFLNRCNNYDYENYKECFSFLYFSSCINAQKVDMDKLEDELNYALFGNSNSGEKKGTSESNELSKSVKIYQGDVGLYASFTDEKFDLLSDYIECIYKRIILKEDMQRYKNLLFARVNDNAVDFIAEGLRINSEQSYKSLCNSYDYKNAFKFNYLEYFSYSDNLNELNLVLLKLQDKIKAKKENRINKIISFFAIFAAFSVFKDASDLLKDLFIRLNLSNFADIIVIIFPFLCIMTIIFALKLINKK